MQVLPINCVNFKGNFQNSQIVRNMLETAPKVSLGRFNEVAQRASLVNDNMLYRIKCFLDRGQINRFKFILERFNKNNEELLEICSVQEVWTEAGTVKEALATSSKVIDDFTDAFASNYPKSYNSSHEKLIKEAYNTLV